MIVLVLIWIYVVTYDGLIFIEWLYTGYVVYSVGYYSLLYCSMYHGISIVRRSLAADSSNPSLM